MTLHVWPARGLFFELTATKHATFELDASQLQQPFEMRRANTQALHI
jgi:hypothetical protein